MAVGLPLKTTYANGDVYSASDVNDTNGTINAFLAPSLATAAGKNAVINGGMDIWQRGTSVVGANNSTTFIADRWNAYRASAGSTFTRQVTGDTTNLPNIQYCLRVARDSGNTGTGNIITAQSVESMNAIRFAGQTVTVSWYARRGANYSAASNNLNYEFITGTGTDQTILGTYTGAVTTTGTKTLTTSWQRFSYTVTLAATATEFGLDFYFTPTGTAGAADFFEITGVQVELGSTATAFARNGSSIQGELAACQRYYYRFGGNNPYQYFGAGAFISSTVGYVLVKNPITMRANPTSIDFSTLEVYDFASSIAVTNVTSSSATIDTQLLAFTIASGGTQYRPCFISTRNSTSGFLGLSAEL
jgi:hypothetical protein